MLSDLSFTRIIPFSRHTTEQVFVPVLFEYGYVSFKYRELPNKTPVLPYHCMMSSFSRVAHLLRSVRRSLRNAITKCVSGEQLRYQEMSGKQKYQL